MTDNEIAEWQLLKMSSGAGKFAIELGLRMDPMAQMALERLLLRRWLTLIDVSALSVNPDSRLCRVFLASDEAMTWFRSVN